MSAEVETMMYVREVPWHGLGTRVDKAVTSKEAIKLAELNWNVISNPIFDVNGNEIKGFKANTRDKDGAVFGVVSDRYRILQNEDAFDFTDTLVDGDDFDKTLADEGIKYETCGSLKGGKTIWLLGKMPERYIVGDKFEPYICFTNSHDGMGAIRVCMTPIRVVCNNTLNLALETATRSWSTKHMGDINSKMNEARHTLKLANTYLDTLADDADRLANEKMTDAEIHKALEEMFPIDDDMSDRQKSNIEKAKDEIMICTFSPDLVKFLNTKWGFLNAVSDFVGHTAPQRLTTNYDENRWGKIMGGHPILDKAMSVVMA